MTDLTVAKLILVPAMGKVNKSPFATGKFNFGSTLVFSGNAARRSRSCGNHQDSSTKQ
jgi:hypothetical protein